MVVLSLSFSNPACLSSSQYLLLIVLRWRPLGGSVRRPSRERTPEDIGARSPALPPLIISAPNTSQTDLWPGSTRPQGRPRYLLSCLSEPLPVPISHLVRTVWHCLQTFCCVLPARGTRALKLRQPLQKARPQFLQPYYKKTRSRRKYVSPSPVGSSRSPSKHS